MADINIVISEPQKEGEMTNMPEQDRPVQTTVSLKARKTADGNILVTDHPDIDIAILTTRNKVVAFPKEFLNDSVYDAQKKLFDYLRKKGVISYDSLQGGNVFGAMEAAYPEDSEYADPLQLVMFTIAKFIERELPGEMFTKKIKDQNKDLMTDPSIDNTTELGEVPHSGKKGALRTHFAPFGSTYKSF